MRLVASRRSGRLVPRSWRNLPSSGTVMVVTTRLRRVYGLEEAGRLLGDVAAKTVTARARTVERASGGARAVLWPRASDVNPSGIAFVWAEWVEGLARFEGHPDPGDVAWSVVALPDLAGMPEAADVTVLGAPTVAGVDSTAGSVVDDADKAELVDRLASAESVADAARAEATVHELARLQALLDAAETRADTLARRAVEVEADRDRWRSAVSLLSSTAT